MWWVCNNEDKMETEFFVESWQKFRKLENRVLDFLIKHYTVLLVVFAMVLAVTVRWKFLSYESRDFTDFLLPWFTALKEGGGLSALATYSGDYNAPYVTILALLSYLPFSPLVLIKLVSIIFDFVLAGAVAYLVYTLVTDKQHKKGLAALAYIMILFLPQVMLNGAFWGQCDAIYASFCVLALTFLLKERYALAFVFLGVAFAFKLQFIFILPIFIVVYVVKRKFSILNFFILPITNIVLCLPAIIAGRPLLDCFLVYFRQTKTYAGQVVLNFVNFYGIFGGEARFWNIAGVILMLIICAVALYWIVRSKMQLSQQKTLELTVWFVVVVTFILPGMHERYLFVGEILAIVYYLVYRQHGVVALMINAFAWITYAYYFSPNTNFNYHYLALIELFVLVAFTKTVFVMNNNGSKRITNTLKRGRP